MSTFYRNPHSPRSPRPVSPSPGPLPHLGNRVPSREEQHLLRNHALIATNHATLVRHHTRILRHLEGSIPANTWLYTFSAALSAHLIFFLILVLTALKWADLYRLFSAFSAVSRGTEAAWADVFDSMAGIVDFPRFSEGMLVYLAALTLAVGAVSWGARHPESNVVLTMFGGAVALASVGGQVMGGVREVEEVVSSTAGNRGRSPVTATPVGYHHVGGEYGSGPGWWK